MENLFRSRKNETNNGRSIDAFVTASLYAAIRIHDFPRLLEEIVDVAMIPLRSVHRSLGLVVRSVLPVLKMRYKPIAPEPLVHRFVFELNLSMQTQQYGSELLRVAVKHGMKKMGKGSERIGRCGIVSFLQTSWRTKDSN